MVENSAIDVLRDSNFKTNNFTFLPYLNIDGNLLFHKQFSCLFRMQELFVSFLAYFLFTSKKQTTKSEREGSAKC